MSHAPYHYDWNTTPSGNPPPADMSSPEGFMRDFANVNIQNLEDDARIFLPDSGQMQNNIAMARNSFGNDIYGQQLSGQDNLLNMTNGLGLNSMPEGFGRRQSSITSGLKDLNQQYQSGLQQSMAGFRSDVLGEQYRYQDTLTSALGNLIQSGEHDSLKVTPNGLNNDNYGAPQNPPSSQFPNLGWVQKGSDGNVYIWNGSKWISNGG